MSHTVGENLIIPAAKEIMQTLIPSTSHDVTSCIPLSNDTVSRRMDEKSKNVESKICSMLKSQKFALQLDGATIRDNEAVLLAYVRFFDVEAKRVSEEMLFMKSLTIDTKGSTIFHAVEDYLNGTTFCFLMLSLVACATDGAASMTGKYPPSSLPT